MALPMLAQPLVVNTQVNTLMRLIDISDKIH